MINLQTYLFLSVIALTICNFFYLYKTRKQIHRILRSTSKNDLESYLESLSAQSKNTDKQLKQLMDVYAEIKNISQHSIQKTSLVRFNPFKDTGGDQSFVLCILDHENSGFLLTAIHNRDGTRVYTKQVINGSAELSLSSEEKQALANAAK